MKFIVALISILLGSFTQYFLKAGMSSNVIKKVMANYIVVVGENIYQRDELEIKGFVYAIGE